MSRVPFESITTLVSRLKPLKIMSKIFPKNLATYWGDFVDCEKRLVREAPFLLSICGVPDKTQILDAALGIGCESIFLLQQGYQVRSNEIEPDLAEISKKKATRVNVELNITQCDWRQLTSGYRPGSFDVILVLGNSLCLVNSSSDRKKCLKQFWSVLSNGGRLVIDERNFSYILKERDIILKGKFRYSREIMYCGTLVQGRPIDISNNNVEFGYFHQQHGLVGRLDMYPFKGGELKKLLLDSGFRYVFELYDFGRSKKDTCDFITYVAIK
jgi:SAM-dependent methyltransferase